MELFSSSSKNKKVHLEKIHYISGNGNPEKRDFLIFQETEILRNSYIQEVAFPAQKVKGFLYFGKWNFLAPSFKDFSYISERNLQDLKIKKFLYYF